MTPPSGATASGGPAGAAAAVVAAAGILPGVELPQPVVDVVTAYLQGADSGSPGLIEGFYLVGSAAMGDFQWRRGLAGRVPSGADVSDVDFVAVTDRPLGDADLETLDRVHRRLATVRSLPSVDGIYLTWADLARDPAEVTGRGQVHGGRLGTSGAGHPVLWHELAQHGVAVRGPHRDDLPIRTDHDRLVAWVRGNLDGYWRRWHRSSARSLSWPGLVSLSWWGPTWGVLGVSRLHHTIRTGEICSKSAGGRYARDEFGPRWHTVLDECLRIRCGLPGRSRYATPVARRRDALGFVEMVVESR